MQAAHIKPRNYFCSVDRTCIMESPKKNKREENTKRDYFCLALWPTTQAWRRWNPQGSLQSHFPWSQGISDLYSKTQQPHAPQLIFLSGPSEWQRSWKQAVGLYSIQIPASGLHYHRSSWASSTSRLCSLMSSNKCEKQTEFCLRMAFTLWPH